MTQPPQHPPSPDPGPPSTSSPTSAPWQPRWPGVADADSSTPPPVFTAPPAQAPQQVPQPGPPPGTDARRAVRQVTEDTRTYPCRNCGDNLVFDPATARLLCPSCGSSLEIVLDPTKRVQSHDLLTFATPPQYPQPAAQLLAPGDPAAASEYEVTCQNCGGKTVFTGTLTAVRCPYCATPIQREDIHDSPDVLPVDGVLPFRVPEPAAREQLTKWIKSRWFAPREFKRYNDVGAFSSIYMSYFVYNTYARTQYAGRRGDHYTVTVGSGDNRRTETRTRWRDAQGIVDNQFTDVPSLANKTIERKRATSLEPWPIPEVVPFTGEFIAGHLAASYDIEPPEAFDLARQETIDPIIDKTIRRDIGGDEQQIYHRQSTFNPLDFRYLLLPLYLLTVTFQNRPFQVYINAITGEVQGNRPYSKIKIALAVLAGLIVIAAIVAGFALSK